MAEEVSLTADCCANCSAPFGGGNLAENNGTNSESFVIKNRTRIKTVIAEINGKDEAVQVADALAEIYHLNWLSRIEIEDDDQILTGDLTVCSECSYAFSQLYKWFTQFQLLRKADSILSSRLNIINSFVDQLLASSNSKNGDGDADADAEDDPTDLMGENEVIQNEMCEYPLELPAIVNVKRERDFGEFFPVITSSESIRNEEHEELISGRNLEAISSFGTDVVPSDLLESTEMEQTTTTEDLGAVPVAVSNLRRIKFESAIIVEDEEIFRLGPEDQSESDVAMAMEGINQSESGLLPGTTEEVNQPVTVFKCVDCDEQFSKAFQLGGHRKDVHGPNEVFKCHICSQVLSSSKVLRYHVMRHSDARPYKCQLCSGTYKTAIDLGSHVRDYHTTKGRQRRHKARVRHRKKHLQRKTTGAGNQKCNICRRAGFSARGLVSHKIQCHGITAKKISAKSQSSLSKQLPHPGFYECHYCGQIFSDVSVFDGHLRSHTQQVIESSIRAHTLQVIESSIRSDTQKIAIQPSEPTSEDSSAIAVASIAALKQQIPVSTGLYGVTVTAVEPTQSLRGAMPSETSDNQPSGSSANSHLLSALTSNSSSTSKSHHSSLLHHLLKRKTQEKFNCNRCTEEFDTATALGLHQFKVHNTSNKCKICKKGFPNQKSLNNHMARHKGTAQHTASPEKQIPAGLPELLPILVSSQLTTASVLNSDSQGTSTTTAAELSEPSEEPVCEFKCLDCDQVFTEGKDLGTHRKQVHGALDPYKCHICGNNSSKPSRLKMHLLRHSANRQFICHTCGKGFVVVYDLRRHQKRTGCKQSELPSAELKTTKSEQKTEVFGCKMCTRAFGSASNLAGHYTSAHVVDFSFQCTMCSGLVDTESEWKEHLTTHFSKAIVQCPICKKVLSSRKNLAAHVKRHTDERNFQCDLCMKTFKVSNDLTRHRRRYHAVVQRTTWENSNGPEHLEHFMMPLIGVEANSEEAAGTSDTVTFE